jgi:hypothetical protein
MRLDEQQMLDDPRLKEPEKPVWQMSPVERVAEGLRRRAVLMKYLLSRNVNIRADGTSMNTYFIDFADDDPRFITIQTIYELPEITDQMRTAAAEASANSFGAKALLSQIDAGCRLRFIAEVVAADLSCYMSSMALYQAQIEDCRERFLSVLPAFQ